MRKCVRCQTEMVEGLEIYAQNGFYGIDIREKGLFKKTLGKIKGAVCKDCGYVETYLENTDKIRELVGKSNIRKL